MSLQGIIRGKQTRATFSDKTAPKLLDRVNRQFKASAPKQAMGFGFYLCRHLAELRLHGLRDRRLRPSYCWMAGEPNGTGRLCPPMHRNRLYMIGVLSWHSNRGVQYMSIRYFERLQKQISSHLWQAEATVTTAPPQKRSTIFTRPKSFIDAIHRGTSKRSNSLPWNG